MRRADRSSRGGIPRVRVCVCDLETSTVGRPKPEQDCCATKRKIETVAYLEVVDHEAKAVNGHT